MTHASIYTVTPKSVSRLLFVFAMRLIRNYILDTCLQTDVTHQKNNSIHYAFDAGPSSIIQDSKRAAPRRKSQEQEIAPQVLYSCQHTSTKYNQSTWFLHPGGSVHVNLQPLATADKECTEQYSRAIHVAENKSWYYHLESPAQEPQCLLKASTQKSFAETKQRRR